jgi:hypothetical protein
VRQTMDDIAGMTAQAEAIAGLMVAGYGESDQRTIRAQEAHGAMVRLQAEMAREPSKGVSQ